MPCTQLMFTSNILHVEDNILLEWKDNCKVTVVHGVRNWVRLRLVRVDPRAGPVRVQL